jgi:mRNA interferase MazF
LSSDIVAPRRGEIWLVNFNPTVGAEINKIRPAVVVSSDAVGRLPIKLVAPLTDWKDRYAANLWHIRLDPDPHNHLDKPSAVDVLQLRGMDYQRFVRRFGRVPAETMEEIAAAIAAVVEYQ